MLKQMNLWLDVAHVKKLAAMAPSKGLKTAQLIRLIIAEYLERHPK